MCIISLKNHFNIRLKYTKTVLSMDFYQTLTLIVHITSFIILPNLIIDESMNTWSKA